MESDTAFQPHAGEIPPGELLRSALRLQLHSCLDDAEKLYRASLASDPENDEVLYLLGVLLHHKGASKRALSFLRKAVQLAPRNHVYFSALAQASVAAGEHAAAIEAYEKALSLQTPPYPEHYNSLGALCQNWGRLDRAEFAFRKSLELAPQYPEAHYNLGNILMLTGRLDEAVKSYDRALSLRSDYPRAYNNKGNALKGLHRIEDAITCYENALALAPDSSEPLINLANCYQELGDFNQALNCYNKALVFSPDFAEAYTNLGNVWKNMCNPTVALMFYEKALSLNPNCVETLLNRAFSLLLLERFEEGWREYEWRLHKAELKSLFKAGLPRWDGTEAPDKGILVLAEQGYGDSIQFARYIPLLRPLCGRIVFQCQKPLHRLISSLPGVDALVSPEESEGHPEIKRCALQIPLLSLPGLFHAAPGNIPSEPYLSVPSELLSKWSARLASLPRGLKVGLCWAGSPTNTNDRNRSMPFRELSPLFEISGVHFFSLQKGPASADAAAMNAEANFSDWTSEWEDFADAAACVSGLDLVISVDTAAAHLAGALGKPVWLLLPYSPEWRWLQKREDSPWYPSMLLFRQYEWGDWTELIKRVKSALLSSCCS
ncbi:MAG: hypothetical protein A2X49_14855 [Lentisphaerae bacterium GWF2_52_8]|nr:MAG: hypothetical protein A2X49_14855 [Lentisphaerae bacterium GWF2_52_8]